MKRLVILLPICVAITTAFAQIVPNATPVVRSITRAEYFFETDPGVGNGTPITNFAAADTVYFTANISTNKLTPGFHILQIRACDTTGIWGMSQARFFYNGADSTTNTTNIVAAEYFVDTDPGPGKGIATSVGTAGAVVNFTALIPTNLSAGFHLLAIRAMDASGKWGLLETRNFYLTSPPEANLPQITAAESFYDNDPGVGNGTTLPVSSGDVITPTFMIPVPVGMSVGNHWLAIRVRNQAGHWSLFEKDTVTVGGTSASITCPHDTTVTAPAGQCTATVNNIDPTVTPAGSAFTYTLSGATFGNGSGTVSGHVFNAGVTTVTYALVSSPATTCSFKVTVNGNIVPSVSINASSTTICAGQQVTFTATPVNGGTPSYQWKLNGNNVGTNSATYQSASISNGDSIQVIMTSSLTCATQLTVTSNTVKIAVSQAAVASVNITASDSSVCSGAEVTFTATPTNGGNAPSYQWKLNGNNVGTNSANYQNATLQNGDTIRVMMTSSLGCVSQPTVPSNKIAMTVGQGVTPSVSITASATNICPGSLVTFTATPSNGGSPHYQWRINGNSVGNDSPTYQSSFLQNGDSVVVYMSSSLACATQQLVLSNTIFMIVSQSVTPSVSITASATSICAGQQVTFTAAPVNGGNNPVYEWTLNNNAVGTSSSTYQNSSLKNGDVVRVTMQSSLGCANQGPVYSNSITMNVGSTVVPSVSIDTPSTFICSGSQATFTATPTNGGSAPTYQWKLNGNNVGSNSASYQNSSLGDGDVIKVEMTSSLGCASPQTAVSNLDTMHVTASLTPSVTISATGTTICAGTSVTFTATPTNGGNSHFEWILNGNEVGTNSNTYQNSSLQNGDSVAVYLTTSLACANPKSVKSNTIAISVDTPSTYYADVDGDGYGNPTSTIQACAAPIGYVSNNGDCDDSNAAVHPGAAEVCGNGIDDNCNGLTDENCDTSVTLPAVILRTYPVKEGNGGLTTLSVEVTLDKPAPLPVSVNWATSNGDAVAGMDYVAASGTLNIPVSSSSGTIQIKIIGDLLKEGNERFNVNFSNPVNVVLPGDSRSRVMIIDDDHGKINNTSLTVPTIARRNQVWVIPEIGLYQNEVVLTDAQGQVVSNVTNYQNNRPIPNVAVGLYFYRIRVMDGQGQVRYYSGRLMITE